MGGLLLLAAVIILIVVGMLADEGIKLITKHFTNKEVNRIKAQQQRESSQREWLRDSQIN